MICNRNDLFAGKNRALRLKCAELCENRGNCIPEQYGLTTAMLLTRDADDALAAARNNCMGCVQDVCAQAIDSLVQEGKLAGAGRMTIISKAITRLLNRSFVVG